MGLKTSNRRIGELDVDTTQLPARRALKLAGKLGRVLAPAFGKVKGLTGQSDLADLAPALGAFFDGLPPNEYDDLLVEILASTNVTADVNGQRRRVGLDDVKRIDEVFGADMMGLINVCIFALQVNYADFIAAMPRGPGAAGGPPAAAGQPSD